MSKQPAVFIKYILLPIATFAVGFVLGTARPKPAVFKDVPIAPSGYTRNIGNTAAAMLPTPTPVPTPAPSNPNNRDESAPNTVLGITQTENSSGLWEVVNEYRRKHGLTVFEKDALLCEFTAVRLEDLKSRGDLDNHEGFRNRVDKYLGQGFNNIAENLAGGYASSDETVNEGWDKSAGHKATLLSTEYNRGCALKGNGFAVFIAAKQQQ